MIVVQRIWRSLALLFFGLFVINIFFRSSSMFSNDAGKECLNPHDFDVIYNPANPCQSYPDLFILIIVYSAPDHFDQRNAIRNTYARPELYLKTKAIVRFFIGLTNNEKVTRKLAMESQQYGDIVRQSYPDSYYNLSLKAIGWMEWVMNFCRQPAYIYKTDDDILVNVFYTYTFLQEVWRQNAFSDGFMCHRWTGYKVPRSPHSKLYVPEREFGKDMFPDFCDGRTYIVPQGIVPVLKKRSVNVQVFRLEDVWTTGFLRTELNIPIYDISLKLQLENVEDLTKGYIAGAIKTSDRLWNRTWNKIYSANN